MAEYNCTNISIVRWYNGGWGSTIEDGFQCGPNKESSNQNGGIIKFTTGSKVLKNYTITINGTIVKRNSSTPTIYVYLYSSDPGTSHTPSGTSSLGNLTYLAKGTTTYNGAASVQAKPITITLTGSEQLNANTTYYLWVTSSTFVNNFDYTNDSTAITISGDEPTIFKIYYDLHGTSSTGIQCTNSSYTIQGTSNHVYYNGSIYTAQLNTSTSKHTVRDLENDFGIIRPGYDCTSYKTSWDVTDIYPGTGYTINDFTNNQDKNYTYLTAQWTPNIYTIILDQHFTSGRTLTYYLKYGVGWYSDAECTQGIVEIEQSIPTGYSLRGYFTESNGNGTKIIDSDLLFLSNDFTTTNETTLHAKWDPNIYKITLDKQSGSGGNSTVYLKYNTGWYSNSTATVSTTSVTAPTRTGFDFDGYYTATSGGTQIIDSGGNIIAGKTAFSANTILYAHWIANTTEYIITFNGNGNTGGNLPDDIDDKKGTSSSVIMGDIDDNVPTKTGAVFRGWSSTSTYNENRVAYYSHSSYHGGGSDSKGNSPTQTSSSWTFQDYLDNTGNSTFTGTTLILYAQWEYPIIFETNTTDTTVSNMPNDGYKQHGISYQLPSNSPTRTGYSFKGWSENSSSTTADYQPNGFISTNATKTLYAIWEQNSVTYTITFNINKGSGNVPVNISKTGTSSSVIMGDIGSNVPTRTGYNFRGWSSTSTYNNKRIAYSNSSVNGGEADYNGISPKITEGSWTFEDYCTNTGSNTTGTTLTLYAQWELKKYAITYYKNAGNTTEIFLEEYKNHGTTYYITTETPTREGYKFLGWSINSAATAPMAAYAAEKPYSTNAIRNLYAVWKKTYTITTQIATGLGTISSGDTYETGTSTALTASPSSGYKFDMWMDEDGNVYNDSTLNIIVTEDKIFSAYFSIIQYSITFNANGGSGKMSNGTKIYDVDYYLPQSDFTPPNETNDYLIRCHYNDGTAQYVDRTCTRIKSYSFKQWRLGSSSGTAYQVSDSYKENNSATFYADWKAGSTTGTVVLDSLSRDNKEIRRTVKFDPNGGTTTPTDQIYTETTSYTFKGWSRSSSATTAAYNTTTGYGFSTETNLYGVWGETQTASDPLILPNISRSNTIQTIRYTFEPQVTELSTTTRIKRITTKYELTGWIDETNNTKLNLSDIYIPTNDLTTLTADWSQSETIGGTYTAPNLSRAGYQLLGWSYQSSSPQEIAYAPGDEITDETNQTFYAVWAQDTFLITLDHQTGNSSINNLKFQYNIGWFDTDDNQLTSINIPTKTGYIFQGYYTDDNSLIITNTGALSDNKTWTNANTTLYAHWIPITYYILYNTSPYVQNQTFPVNYDSVHTTKAAIPRTHTITYENNGGNGGVQQHTSTIYSSYWIDENNIKRLNNTTIKNLTTTNEDIIELKPHWDLDAIILPTLTQSGYNFLGWYDSDGVKIGNGGTPYIISKDITLYAHWDPIGLVQIRYNGQWRKAIPYIYDGGKWKRAITSIQTSENPNNPVWQTGVNYGQHKLIN